MAIYFTVSLGVSCLTSNVEGKKIPGFIKKMNKFLGLPPKSNKIMDILLISSNTAKINNIAGTVSKNTGNIAKNIADISKYHCINKHMTTLLDYSAVDPANVPQNISDYWELNVDIGQWTSFVNWPIAAPLCNVNSWLGLLNDDPNGYIRTKLEGFGTGRLDFGNCWTSGIVKVFLDGIEIASAQNSTPNKIVEFAFDSSELEIREEDMGILVFNSFEVLTCQDRG